MPMNPAVVVLLVGKVARRIARKRNLDGEGDEIEGCRRELEETDLAVHRCILLAVEVGLQAVGETVGLGFVVVMVEIMVELLQYDYLKDEHRQEDGDDLAICNALFHQGSMDVANLSLPMNKDFCQLFCANIANNSVWQQFVPLKCLAGEGPARQVWGPFNVKPSPPREQPRGIGTMLCCIRFSPPTPSAAMLSVRYRCIHIPLAAPHAPPNPQ